MPYRKNNFNLGADPHRDQIYRLLAESIPTVYFSIDNDEKFTFVEGATLNFVGLHPTEVIGKKLGELFPENYLILHELRHTLNRKKPSVINDQIDGRWFEVITTPLTEDGVCIGLTGMALDLTGRYQNRTEREASQEKMLKMTSHDLRSLLSGVVGFLRSIVHQNRVVQLEPAEKNLFRSMLQNCEDALELAESITDAPHVSSEVFGFKPCLAEIREFFFALFEEAQILSRAKGRRLILNLEHAPRRFWIDPSLIKRAVMNLITNAFRHTSKGQFVELRVRENEMGDLVISVKDEGCGLPQDDATRLLESSAERFLKSAKRGLGLFIVQNIVQAHGGCLDVVSAPQQGTRFTITLPNHMPR